MSLTMGQTIKRLRKERNFTQEELAEQLDVTYQAVSKWENEAGLPDISQIVPLARVFGVSTDVLFGTFGLNDDEEVERIISKLTDEFKNRVDNLAVPWTDEDHFPLVEQFYESLIEALKQYPNNIKLLRSCLGHGVHFVIDCKRLKNDTAKADKTFAECVREANLIINYGKDMTAIMQAHMWLVRLYSFFGNYEKATEHANMFPDGFQMCKGAQLSWIKRASNNTDEEIKQRCNNIFSLLETLHWEVLPLGTAYYNKKQYEDALYVYKSIFGIISAVYGDEEYTPPLNITGNLHVRIADCHWKLNDADNAFLWLEKMIELHITNDKYYNKRMRLETPLLREFEFKSHTKTYGLKNSILNDLNWFGDGGIRDTERFKALMDKANSMEG